MIEGCGGIFGVLFVVKIIVDGLHFYDEMVNVTAEHAHALLIM